MAAKENVSSVETYLPIKNLQEGFQYEQIFLIDSVTHNENMITAKNQPFAEIVIKDITGSLSGKVWNYEGGIQEGQYAVIKIDLKKYKDQLTFQCQYENIEIVDKPLNIFDYVDGMSESALMQYAGEIESAIMSIVDESYRNIMYYAINTLDLMQALKESPYGLQGSMSYPGGLLVHTAHALRFAKIANQQAKETEIPFSSSLVIAGCILRNIGWYTTTKFHGDKLRSRDAYYMIGIQRASTRYIDHLMLSAESDVQMTVPESKRQALENVCNKQADINTLEGQIIACSDNMADILDFGATALGKKKIGNWAEELFIGHLHE